MTGCRAASMPQPVWLASWRSLANKRLIRPSKACPDPWIPTLLFVAAGSRPLSASRAFARIARSQAPLDCRALFGCMVLSFCCNTGSQWL